MWPWYATPAPSPPPPPASIQPVLAALALGLLGAALLAALLRRARRQPAADLQEQLAAAQARVDALQARLASLPAAADGGGHKTVRIWMECARPRPNKRATRP